MRIGKLNYRIVFSTATWNLGLHTYQAGTLVKVRGQKTNAESGLATELQCEMPDGTLRWIDAFRISLTPLQP